MGDPIKAHDDGKPTSKSNVRTENVDELIKFKQEHGYPKGFNSKEEYEEWLEKRTKNKKQQTTPVQTEAQQKPIDDKTDATVGTQEKNIDSPTSSVSPSNIIDDTTEVAEKATKKATTNTAEKVTQETAEKVAKMANKADDIAEIKRINKKVAKSAVDKTPDWAGTAGLIIGGIVVAATMVDMGLNAQERARTSQQKGRQERNRKRREDEFNDFDESIYYNLDELNGLPQELYSNRTGHSNTWGGRRY